MRESIKQFVKIVSETLPIAEPIYEFGSLQVDDQVGWADLRAYFPGKQYIGCDMREGPGVDLVENIHELTLPDHVAGTVLAMDTLEHVENPYQAMAEIFRVLRPGGIAVISSVMNFPIHDYPYDYWRFTPEAFRSLLKGFDKSFVGWAGDPKFPHTVVGVGFAACDGPSDEFLAQFELWQPMWIRNDRPTLPPTGVSALIKRVFG